MTDAIQIQIRPTAAAFPALRARGTWTRRDWRTVAHADAKTIERTRLALQQTAPDHLYEYRAIRQNPPAHLHIPATVAQLGSVLDLTTQIDAKRTTWEIADLAGMVLTTDAGAMDMRPGHAALYLLRTQAQHRAPNARTDRTKRAAFTRALEAIEPILMRDERRALHDAIFRADTATIRALQQGTIDRPTTGRDRPTAADWTAILDEAKENWGFWGTTGAREDNAHDWLKEVRDQEQAAFLDPTEEADAQGGIQMFPPDSKIPDARYYYASWHVSVNEYDPGQDDEYNLTIKMYTPCDATSIHAGSWRDFDSAKTRGATYVRKMAIASRKVAKRKGAHLSCQDVISAQENALNDDEPTTRSRNGSRNDEAEAEAGATYAEWHEREPEQVTHAEDLPDVIGIYIGRALRIGYRSDKWHERGETEDYDHDYTEPGYQPPEVWADHIDLARARAIVIVGGNQRITADGID